MERSILDVDAVRSNTLRCVNGLCGTDSGVCKSCRQPAATLINGSCTSCMSPCDLDGEGCCVIGEDDSAS